MVTYFSVAVGSALGGMLRYWLSEIITNWIVGPFPWGTLAINITGSFAIGFFGTLTATNGVVFVPTDWRLFFMVGVCGGYTTFSSFSLQTLTLAQNGNWLSVGANIGLSVTLCLLAVWLGHVGAEAAGRLWTGR